MKERPIYFGPDNSLLGILTLPESGMAGYPTVLFLNAGLLHRVGPNRLYVDTARRLASSGVASFRFDMSGIGDSDHTGSSLLYIDRSVADVTAAMDALERLGHSPHFVAAGLCTGAYNAFRAALADSRVQGCILLDGYSYPTMKSKIRHQRRRILDPGRWVRFAKRKLSSSARQKPQDETDLVIFENEAVTQERFGTELQSLIERGVEMLFVYTRYGPLAYNYRDQIYDAFPSLDLRGSAVVEYFPDADHTFTLPGNRNRLVEDIEAWLLEKFALLVDHERNGEQQ